MGDLFVGVRQLEVESPQLVIGGDTDVAGSTAESHRAAEVLEVARAVGGDVGRVLNAHVIALKPGHPYLRLPLQFSVALESRLLETLGEDELASLRQEAEGELAEAGRWGTTFTVIQSWGRRP